MFIIQTADGLIPEQKPAKTLEEAARLAIECDEQFVVWLIDPAKNLAVNATAAVLETIGASTLDGLWEPVGWLADALEAYGVDYYRDGSLDLTPSRGRRAFARHPASTLNHVQQFGGRP